MEERRNYGLFFQNGLPVVYLPKHYDSVSKFIMIGLCIVILILLGVEQFLSLLLGTLIGLLMALIFVRCEKNISAGRIIAFEHQLGGVKALIASNGDRKRVGLLDHNKNQPKFSIPDNFGDLHGKLFKSFVSSAIYKQHFNKPPVICLSVSDNKIYHRSENQHPVLGFEYHPNESSLTEQYFRKMGLQVRYFMPPNSAAPLAFYFFGDLLNDYTNLELISTISTMETFQKIYRPEIYNANSSAGQRYQPNLKNSDHSLTQIVYDREERSKLAVEQGKFTEEYFIKPYRALLEQWSANYVL